MNLKQIKKLIELVANSSISEIEICEKDVSIRISTGTPSNKNQMDSNIDNSIDSNMMINQKAQNSIANFEKDVKEETFDENCYVVKSPMVGTFYRRPNPSKPCYVEEGDKITAGQALCIIEAMKMMNEIKSEFSGEVKKILISDASPVEYDTPLFIIKR